MKLKSAFVFQFAAGELAAICFGLGPPLVARHAVVLSIALRALRGHRIGRFVNATCMTRNSCANTVGAWSSVADKVCLHILHIHSPSMSSVHQSSIQLNVNACRSYASHQLQSVKEHRSAVTQAQFTTRLSNNFRNHLITSQQE